MGEPKLKKLLTSEEVAKMLNVSEVHVWNMARTGELPKVPGLGRLVRFNPDMIEKKFFSDAKKK